MEDVKFDSKDVVVNRNFPGRRDIHVRSGFRISQYQQGVARPPLDRVEPRYFEFYSLCHLVEGEGWYWTPAGGFEYLSSGNGILVSPRFVHHYGGHGTIFREDFICFDGPVADYMYRAGVLRDGIIKIGVVRRLLPVMKLALNLTDRGQLAAQGALQNLLYDLYLDNSREEREGPDRFARLLEKLSADTEQWWTVTEMASYCHLSENQFRRRFRERTGMGPKHYYDSLKMQLAAARLLRGETLDRIARELGYRDGYHLSKVFKRIHSLSPDNYRRKYRI